MKLRGIKDSKRRRVAYERNQELRAPDGPMLAGHSPSPHADGSLACSGCYRQRYSPAAFAKHLTGAPILDADGNGVFTTGPNDPFLISPERQRKAADAATRAAQVDAFFEEQRRQRMPRVADGVGVSAFFE